MTERACAPTEDCMQYCRALDSVGGFEYAPREELPCDWPEHLKMLQQSTIAKRPEGALLRLLGAELDRTLLEAASTEEVLSLETRSAINDVFTKQLDIWEYKANALNEGRKITSVEARFFTTELKATQIKAAKCVEGTEGSLVTLAQARHDRSTLSDYGLLFDAVTTGTVDRLVDNITHGRPTLLVGHKGIAKTKMAEFASGLFSKGKEVTIISGHGSMMSDELVGKTDLVEGEGTVFHEGKLVQCMREGRPLILDEVNVGDQQVMMRLQDILLKKPGQTIVLQENGNEPIVVQPGFCVLATANEASAHYNNREQLDPAFRDRFDVINVQYPDSDVVHITDHPPVNERLALAHAISDNGQALAHVSAKDAVALARLAHATQRLYSHPVKDVAPNMAGTTSDIIDPEEPLLTDCITPRKMVTILERVAAGTLPEATILTEITRTVAALDQHGTRNQTYVNTILSQLKLLANG